VLNEFVSSLQLVDLKAAGKFTGQRSLIIMTYALCGFANIVSIGIQVGGIGALAPNQRSTLAKLGVKALIGGSIACFLTACIAGFSLRQLAQYRTVKLPPYITLSLVLPVLLIK